MSKSTRRRRHNLWRKDPHCYWCGVVTVEVVVAKFEKPPDNLATLDHLHSRYDPRRGATHGVASVLSCLRCNNEREVAETAQRPLDDLRFRSQMGRVRK